MSDNARASVSEMATLAVTALPNRQENCPASSRGGGCRWVTVSDYRGFYNQEDGQNNLHVVERVGKLGRWRNHKHNFKELGSKVEFFGILPVA